MYPSRDALAGILCIAGLVTAAHWFARNIGVPQDIAYSAGASRSRSAKICVRTIDWSADGRMLLARSCDGEGNESVVVYTLRRGDAGNPIDVTRQPTGAAALAPDGLHVLIGTNGGMLYWIDVKSFETVSLVESPPESVFTSVAIAADGRAVAAGTNFGCIFICDPNQDIAVELESDRDISSFCSICDLRFSHDGRLLVSCHADGSIATWDLASRECRHRLTRHEKTATGAAFLPDGRRIVSVGQDDRMRVWDMTSGTEEWHAVCGLGGINALAVSPDGKSAACGGLCGKVVVWDLPTRRQKFEFMTAAVAVKDLKFSFDGGTLAASGLESKIRFYDTQSGAEQPGIVVGRANSPAPAPLEWNSR